MKKMIFISMILCVAAFSFACNKMDEPLPSPQIEDAVSDLGPDEASSLDGLFFGSIGDQVAPDLISGLGTGETTSLEGYFFGSIGDQVSQNSKDVLLNAQKTVSRAAGDYDGYRLVVHCEADAPRGRVTITSSISPALPEGVRWEQGFYTYDWIDENNISWVVEGVILTPNPKGPPSVDPKHFEGRARLSAKIDPNLSIPSVTARVSGSTVTFTATNYTGVCDWYIPGATRVGSTLNSITVSPTSVSARCRSSFGGKVSAWSSPVSASY